MFDLICDVISFRVWSCDMGKINIGYMREHDWKQEKRENMEVMESKEIFLHKSPSNRWFRNVIHRLLIRADARGSADIIYRMWRMSILVLDHIFN